MRLHIGALDRAALQIVFRARNEPEFEQELLNLLRRTQGNPDSSNSAATSSNRSRWRGTKISRSCGWSASRSDVLQPADRQGRRCEQGVRAGAVESRDEAGVPEVVSGACRAGWARERMSTVR